MISRAFFLLISLLVAGGFLRAEDYLRLRVDTHGTRHLDIASRRFRVGKGAEARDVLLLAVSHIGDGAYYQKIQRRLNRADLVLFEGVDGHREEFRNLNRHKEEIGRSNLQAKMAAALGLEFQLFAIDYTSEHFRNSDVTTAQLRDLFNGDEMGEDTDLDEKDMEKLLRDMRALSVGGRVMASILDVVEARPEWGRAMRWSMATVMGNLKGHISEYPGIPPDIRELLLVLLDKRNDVVMGDIRNSLREIEPGQTLVVFYGAAHMADFERRLIKEFEAEVVKTEWLEAFGGNLDASGLNVLQRSMVRGFVKQQLAALKWIVGDDDPKSSTPTSTP